MTIWHLYRFHNDLNDLHICFFNIDKPSTQGQKTGKGCQACPTVIGAQSLTCDFFGDLNENSRYCTEFGLQQKRETFWGNINHAICLKSPTPFLLWAPITVEHASYLSQLSLFPVKVTYKLHFKLADVSKTLANYQAHVSKMLTNQLANDWWRLTC